MKHEIVTGMIIVIICSAVFILTKQPYAGIACVKSTCFNMTKAGYCVHVISDCVTSYDLEKIDEMLKYYESKGCEVKTLAEYIA